MINESNFHANCSSFYEANLLNAESAACNFEAKDSWVRRSTRKPVNVMKEERRTYLKECLTNAQIERLLQVCEHPVKGRCVLAGRLFMKKEFVVEYRGDLIDLREARLREAEYAKSPEYGSYMFYFRHYEKVFCVDATAETQFKGRLISHSRAKANLIAEVVEADDSLHLVLTATRNIDEGEELLFDYGDRSPAALKHYSWLKE